jgi:ABC-type phosphate/phosphonate transport system substrate-binding protein
MFMPHDIFISYSSKDRVIADAIVSNFEKNGIRCWCAPRDIGPGDDWGEAITRAIDACPLFLLIFSGNANASKHVLDELYYSLAEEKVVIPFRVENLDPSGAMRLHLSSLHWLDAYDPSWESHIDRLFETVSANLSKEISREREKFDPQDKIKSPLRGKIGTPRILLGVSLVAIIALFIVFGIPWLRDLTTAPADYEEPTPLISPTAALPTHTEAPLATATPTLEPSPTPIPLGSVENPIIWMFSPDQSADIEEINAAMEDVVAAFDAWSEGLILKLIPAIDPTSMVAALCDGETSVASLPAFHYLVASKQGCANVKYVWTGFNDINFGGMIVTPVESDISNFADLAGKTLCIPEYTSASGWLLPSLELRAAGIDPDSSQITIVESGDHYSVLEDVIEGHCDAGSAFYDARQGSDIENVEEVLMIIAETVAVPNTNISFGSIVDDETSQLLLQFLAYITSTEGKPESMARITVYPTTSHYLIEINEYYYDSLKDLIERAGLSAEEAILLAE